MPRKIKGEKASVNEKKEGGRTTNTSKKTPLSTSTTVSANAVWRAPTPVDHPIEIQNRPENVHLTAKNIQDLDELGYTVVKGIISRERCEYYLDEVWEWFASLGTGIERDKPETWDESRWPHNSHGIIQHHAVGQQQFVWDLRMEENLLQTWSEIFNGLPGYDLLSSFDGLCYMRGGGTTRHWTHTDQSFLKEGRTCIQGFVNLIDATEKDSTLVVYEKSHLIHSGIYKHKWNDLKFFCPKKRKDLNRDWFIVPETFCKEIEKDGSKYLYPPSSSNSIANFFSSRSTSSNSNSNSSSFPSSSSSCPSSSSSSSSCSGIARPPVPMRRVKVAAEPGDLVLWDSRTLHQNSFREDEGWTNAHRFVIYTCMTPRSWASSKDLEKKRKAFEEMRMTSHWPHKPKLFSKSWRTWGQDIPNYQVPFRLPQLTDLGKRTAGC